MMLAGIWRRATSGETDAVNVVLSIEARRSKLLGLDAPAKIAQTDKGGNDIPPLSRYSNDELLLMAAFKAKAQGVELTPQEAAALERWQRYEAATTEKGNGDRQRDSEAAGR